MVESSVISYGDKTETGIMRLTQSAEIEQRLQDIRADIEEQTQAALDLECTEDTVKEIKKVRADLLKKFNAVESQRKELKKAVLAPYEAFEAIYKVNVTDIFKPADMALMQKITAVENELLRRKTNEVTDYFNEYKISQGLPNLEFEVANIKVNLSTSLKRLKEQSKDFIDKVKRDLEWIDSQEYASEISAEYFKNYDAVLSSNIVNRRIEEQKKADELRQKAVAATEEQKKAEEAAKEVVEEQREEQNEILGAPQALEQAEEIYEVSFTVRGTKAQIKGLKEYLMKEGLVNG